MQKFSLLSECDKKNTKLYTSADGKFLITMKANSNKKISQKNINRVNH